MIKIDNVSKVYSPTRKHYKHNELVRRRCYEGLIDIVLISFLLIVIGCGGLQKKDSFIEPLPEVESSSIEDEVPADNNIGEIRIREFFLSPGDEMKITVYRYEELTRSMRIPPDGIIFYPIVGEINTRGKSLRELRYIITEGLSKYKEQTLLPGDEIFISVFRQEEYNRRIIIPSDGFIFFPYVGEIQVETKSLNELRQIITAGLAEYVVDPQVMIDIVELNSPTRIADPQVSIEVVGFGGQKVFVLGEVQRPGVFLADGHTNILEAIAMAGGPTQDAKLNSILLIRVVIDMEEPELILVSLEDFLRDGDTMQNPVLQSGDIIFIPRTFIANVDRFFVHLAKIVAPLLDIGRGIWIGQNIIESSGRVSAVP